MPSTGKCFWNQVGAAELVGEALLLVAVATGVEASTGAVDVDVASVADALFGVALAEASVPKLNAVEPVALSAEVAGWALTAGSAAGA